MRLQQVSYYQVIYNGVLAAQIVSFVPAQLATLLAVDPSKVVVLAIRDSSNSGTSKKRSLVTSNDQGDAILLTVAIPTSSYWALNSLVVNKSSSLYETSASSFGQYVDSTFPLSGSPPPNVSGSFGMNNPSVLNPLTGDEFGSQDPDTVTPGGNGSGTGTSSSSSNGALIGSLVGAATIAYVGIALVIVRRNRRKKEKKAEARFALQQSISAPIGVQGSEQGWGWHSG
ncbi:hypothetical protein BGZ80_010086 [Entomortierella chlamydospora]|uniref:Uncharacterized protein n=1 Tax=Entomortierella chlamydospora TaxID=101097 RepID=A0A9P6MWE2_9FUNG|nr:hypothetical protein BGZ80_010086 [Entomortierella chlamydospora]